MIGFRNLSGAAPDLQLVCESLRWLDGAHPPHRCPRKSTKQSEWNANETRAVRLIPEFPHVRAPFVEPPTQEIARPETAFIHWVIGKRRWFVTQPQSSCHQATAKLCVLITNHVLAGATQIGSKPAVFIKHFPSERHICAKRWLT